MKDATYFFHPSNASRSLDMLEIRAEHGWAGYGLAWAIIERVCGGKQRTLPMQELRSFWLETGSDRRLFLDVLEMLLASGWLAKKWVRDEEIDVSLPHLHSPLLDAQLQDKQLQRLGRAFEPRERNARPAIPKEVRQQVLATGCCAYCGSTEELQVDHIHPWSKGGAHSIENFQALCRPCNYAKRDKTEAEYFALIGRANG